MRPNIKKISGNKQDIHIAELEGGVAIVHTVYKNEGCMKSAKIILELIKKAQKDKPDILRYLFLDIEGHRLESGAFDREMFSLQTDIVLSNLLKYLTEAYTPLQSWRNLKQSNDIPDIVVNLRGTDKYWGEHEEK